MSKNEFSLPPRPGRLKVWKIAGLSALFTMLGLAFWGYLTPGMRVQWENFVAFCGF